MGGCSSDGVERWQCYLASVVDVAGHLAPQPPDLFPQRGDRVVEGDVLFAQSRDLPLETNDALLLPLLTALGRLAVLRPLQLQLTGLGVVQEPAPLRVNRRRRGRMTMRPLSRR